MKIILLPESWASRIAAGEVVERPASVVKELVENALDAGAKEISVRVEGSGTSLIRVSDDGEGIAAEDLPLALERHATSKLKNEADLFCIATLGFRGEALPSIGSIAKLEIISRTRQEGTGCRLRVEGGKKGEPIAAGCPLGTTVEVRELFFNTPARRKFLKSPGTELSHICDVVNRMALAFKDIHFRLYHGDRVLADYPQAFQLTDRLHQVLGREIADSLTPFSWNRGKVKISGFLSFAPSSYSHTRHLLIYVNRRFVRDRILIHAVLQGYQTLLMKGRYPAAALYLEIPFEEVDVNVHPSKYEVRFRRQAELHDTVAEAVREALKKAAKGPWPTVEQGKQPFFGVRDHPLPYAASAHQMGIQFSHQHDGASEAEQEATSQGYFSSLEIMGQLLGCYLVCISPRGMVLIDQHAAHERVAFENMRHQIQSGKIERQNLLIPQILEFPIGEAAVFGRRLGMLDHLGFTVDNFGPYSFAIKAVPALLPSGDYREAMRRMVAEFVDIGRSEELRQELQERLMTIACHSVIRANRKLDKEEIQALLNDLDKINFATQCPHGRPVLLEFTQEQLERMFKRA